ncbi:MAG: SWIM zinc finger family protein [Thermoleophilaceae bacterium]
MVGPLRVSAGRVAARVQGTGEYEVILTSDGKRFDFGCSCPIGAERGFCKHCVAVALTWLRERTEPAPTLDDARALLEALPAEALAELLIDHAHEDDALARKLLLMTARPATGAAPDAIALRAMVDQAFTHHGFVSWREMYGYARGIDETIDVIEELVDGDDGEVVVELCEYALAVAERALDHVDDSGGEMRAVFDRLEEIHLAACRRGRPDAIALAERLFAREVEGEWDVFHRAVVRYADVLGDEGMEHYRQLAEERWAKVPALGPGDDTRGRYGERFRVTRIIQALAELSGRLTEQIAVHERDLSSGYRFLEIAELCRRHGADDAALEWAERGMNAFDDSPDPRLRSFLIVECRRRGWSADALQHSLAAFESRPTLESYRALVDDARAVDEWPARRAAALALLRKPDPGVAGAARHPPLRGRGCSELVRVLLWEGDTDAAWNAANEGGCVPELWLTLADRRRAEHPADALVVYRRHVQDTIGQKDKRAYQQAVELIDGTVRALFAECGRAAEFAAYVEEVRAAHKPKRNLMKLMASLP